MVEVRVVVDGLQINYTGLFRMDELYSLLKQRIGSKGYFIEERMNREDILENGKQIYMELMPMRPLNDYERSVMRLEVHVKGLKDKVITIDGHKQKYQQGEVKIIIFGYHRADHRNKWEDAGWQFLVRTVMDKFVRHSQTHKIEDMIRNDCQDILNEIRSYLNMTRFKVSHDMHPHKG